VVEWEGGERVKKVSILVERMCLGLFWLSKVRSVGMVDREEVDRAVGESF